MINTYKADISADDGIIYRSSYYFYADYDYNDDHHLSASSLMESINWSISFDYNENYNLNLIDRYGILEICSSSVKLNTSSYAQVNDGYGLTYNVYPTKGGVTNNYNDIISFKLKCDGIFINYQLKLFLKKDN